MSARAPPPRPCGMNGSGAEMTALQRAEPCTGSCFHAPGFRQEIQFLLPGLHSVHSALGRSTHSRTSGVMAAEQLCVLYGWTTLVIR
mmetsp:Transcript_88950/g.224639  ORF Transcript_88950/g.224639 Transcript_88950/m.224639 type:complete len:87 (-) Transcript_88950:42-302(-)